MTCSKDKFNIFSPHLLILTRVNKKSLPSYCSLWAISRTGYKYLYLRYHLASPYIGALSQNADTFLTLNAGVTLPNTLAYAIWQHPQRSIYQPASLSGFHPPELSVSASADLISVSTVCGFFEVVPSLPLRISFVNNFVQNLADFFIYPWFCKAGYRFMIN